MNEPCFCETPAFIGDRVDGTCPVCGNSAIFDGFTENTRESGYCSSCGSFNRQRQMASALRKRLGLSIDGPIIVPQGVCVYNTETTGALHDQIADHCGYVSSEYFGPEYPPGTDVCGIRNENLQNLSFADEAFDIVLSSDVLEHMPSPYLAHQEIFRILKPGGSHLFTVPFSSGLEHDDVRAVLEDGKIKHLSHPLYHGDPVRPNEGILVWTIFGLEMLRKISDIGFNLTVNNLYNPSLGIVGEWPLVFEATRPGGVR